MERNSRFRPRQAPAYAAACRRPSPDFHDECSGCGFVARGTDPEEVMVEFRQHLLEAHRDSGTGRFGLIELNCEVGGAFSQYEQAERMIEFLFETA